jgi:hypothetical protein
MPRLSPIQESFASGYIGKRVRGRVSSDVYKQGLSECLNWHPLVQGPIKLRNGSKYVTPVDSDNWVAGQVGVEGLRCFTFQRDLGNDVIVEVGADNITLRDSVSGDVLVGGNTGNLITDPDFQTLNGLSPPLNSSSWATVEDAYVVGTDPGIPQDDTCSGSIATVRGSSFIYMFSHLHNNPDGFRGPSIGNTVSSVVNIPAGSELLVNEVRFTYYQNLYGNEETILGTSPWADPAIRFNVGTTPGASDVYTTDIAIGPFTVDNDVVINFTPGANNNTLYFTIGIVFRGAASWGQLLTVGCHDDVLATWIRDGIEWDAPLAGGSGTPATFTSPYNADQLECLQFCMDPGEQVMYFTHPEVETQRLRLNNGEWTLEALSTITLPSVFVAPSPNPWAAGNWPATCAIHEGRLWLGGSPLQPATLWASRSGNYQDFNGAAPAQADDPLLFPLSSSGRIQTISSRKELVVNTDISEVIGTSVQGVIAYNDFSFPKQTDWGSNCVQPLVAGRQMVFTSNSRARLRTFSDEGDEVNGWDGNELSLTAQELFSSPVRRMVYLDEPSYQACFLLEDGTMAMATFFYPENVIGWWRYETAYNGNRTYGNTSKPGLGNQETNGIQGRNQIVDITKINTAAGAKLWMIVNRTGFSGTTLPGHEVLAFDEPGAAPVSLDSWAVRPIDPGTGRISDIGFLDNQSINCIVERVDPTDGSVTYTVHPNITSIAGVSSPFEGWAVQAGNTAHVGLFFDNNFKLLPREGASNRGTSQVSKMRWNNIVLRVSDSALPLVEGEYTKDRTPSTAMGTGEPIITGDVEYSELGTGKGDIEIIQDKPLVAEIDTIFGKLASGEI